MSPLVDGPLGRLLVNGYFTLVLLSALFSLRDDRWIFRLGLGVGIPAVLMIWIGLRLESEPIIVASQLLAAAFFAVTAVGLARRAMAPGRVGMARILASLCAYLMIGLVWAEVYAAMAVLSPGSFNAPREWSTMEGGELLSTAVYFSYVTLTTLGYGDVTPASEAARSLAVTEAVVGQLYLTVMVARLVGLYVAHEQSGGAA